jgi:response regulator RpfG family c-di-GMP phosphodiesterase
MGKVKHKILFVDDEINTLSAFKRLFFNENDIEVFTASNGAEGLKILGYNEIDLVISDMKMPQLSGNEFLKYVKDKYPGALRIMLTAYADIPATLDAINNGEVYRFLTKPWNNEDFRITVLKALDYLDLKKRNEELSKIIWRKNRELTVLNENLEVKVKQRTVQLETAIDKLRKISEIFRENFHEIVILLTGTIALFNKELASHSKRVAGLVESLTGELVIEKEEREVIIHSAFLHDLGLIGAPEDTQTTDYDHMSEDAKNYYLYHPIIGEKLVGSVKTLSQMAKTIRSHHEEYNGSGFPDKLRGALIPLGAQIIKIASDYDNLVFRKGKGHEEAVKLVKEESYKSYSPDILTAFIKVVTKCGGQPQTQVIRVKVRDLKPGMYLLDEINLENGVLLVPKGVVVTESITKKIITFNTLLRLDREVEIKVLGEPGL